MFDRIEFFIHDNKIEVGGREFLLGELSADIMSITPDEFDEINKLFQEIQAEKDQESMRKLHGLLMNRILFQLISKNDMLGTVEQYRQIIGDIFSSNQTMFHFTDKFLMHLKKLDAENYAAALLIFSIIPALTR